MTTAPTVAAGSGKLRRPSATALLGELTKLRSQQKYLDAVGGSGGVGLEHTIASSHSSSVGGGDDIRQLRASLEDEFRQFRRTAHENLADCRRQLQEFVRMQSGATDSGVQRLDMRSVRDEVVRLDRLIDNLRTASDTGRLRDEYAALLATMPAISDALLLNEMPVKAWPSGRPAAPTATSASLAARGSRMHQQNSSAGENRDVRRFLDLLAGHGGHTGGWSDAEHQLYVRVKAKCGGGGRPTTTDDMLVASVRNALLESKRVSYYWFA